MTKCPKCNKEIKILKLRVVKHSIMMFDGKNYDEDEYFYPSETDEEWVCPKCEEVLDIEDDGEATEFLENDKLKEIVKNKLEKIKKRKCTK